MFYCSCSSCLISIALKAFKFERQREGNSPDSEHGIGSSCTRTKSDIPTNIYSSIRNRLCTTVYKCLQWKVEQHSSAVGKVLELLVWTSSFFLWKKGVSLKFFFFFQWQDWEWGVSFNGEDYRKDFFCHTQIWENISSCQRKWGRKKSTRAI